MLQNDEGYFGILDTSYGGACGS